MRVMKTSYVDLCPDFIRSTEKRDKILVKILEGRADLGKPGHRWKDNNKNDFK